MKIASFLPVLSCATLAMAQVADECAGALPLGLGTTAFDTSGATTSFAWPCAAGGSDIWFRFTAPADGIFVFDTCTGTAYDSALEVFGGGCANLVSLACNDDSCGFQSRLVLGGAIQGTDYYLRVGGFASATGPGSLTVTQDVPLLNPSNGHYYQAVPGDTTWDEARMLAEASSWMGMGGHLATITDHAENDFLDTTLGDPTTGSLNYLWLGGFQDLNDPLYSEPGGAWKWITGEPMGYTNWWPGEPNNAGAFGAEDLLEILHGPQFGGALSWNDVADFEHNRGYLVEFEPGGGVGTSYCSPAIPNSSGAAASITASGSPLVALNNLTLTADQMPAGQFGYFLAGQTQGFFNPPGSQGLICLTGNIGRYNQVANIIQGPTGSLQLDLGSIPVNPPTAVQPGETWNFQCWFRDNNPSLTSNFTDGVSVAFQ